ncbi:DUF6157 family protein [Dietzia psychralcaliphila]|uniref:Uncharacterized protein n=1 Tax=Dietzia psychralcaliphila TaxID=139021 RepID=A0AAD0JNX5_9ACTN|nr:DUF6157 family protein [Dietzia psychralcaliphila]AWH94835.1 hypothetical protein A6048_04245 [Dietzia psychralcaliphila]PTM86871.1 hypothetical protein C8N39_106201 [Dietzia psychralcaliphila]
MHSTDYTDTLILPAPDTRAESATEPPTGKRSIAELQYERLSGADYTWTSDDLIFDVHCVRKGIGDADRAAERERFFSKGQPCLRTSPLAKTYGWALHFDSGGRIALLRMGSDRVTELESDPTVTVRSAMKSSR